MKQRLTVLGSTGSIGTSTLDVVARHPDRFEVFALSAATQVDLMLAQCAQFSPRFAVMASAPHARLLAEKIKANGLKTTVLQSSDALEIIASNDDVDTVMAAIVGSAGLAPCLAAAWAGKRLLLANKEALVVGGDVFLDAVREGAATLLPIDSEHSAIFQSLPEDPATWTQRVEKIILTASGGPFRTRTPDSLRDVTPEQACAHPNWNMGRKISVDSATMMNKALEVIEARYLFGLAPVQLDVVIHPQSIIHSMVQYRDTSVVAQLGTPDMRVPIAYGLAWPERVESGAAALNFHALSAMTFEAIDGHGHRDRFPGLQLAWDALAAPQGTTAVLNAANEVAVAAFLERRIRFDQIHHLNIATLEAVSPSNPDSLNALLALDAQARSVAEQAIGRLAA
ncbi:MAG: 1-deoxy-D-xylulose-5-phosphate reductoisomerase [Acidovorax sp. 17-64-282]|jgi:1-deoxy-D-xylulose-5-phosphate reductoisomerase|uniref:1-deoxy-D-xylulose-5-phosphate reductoisomerase n=1 Tax=unclassified Acidovorax TaxID=2684926 RepID=UPI000BD41947|nr:MULTISPECIES: 1-deoxy-D-xylulose-5-phosphate reductoisomerase [unclassified Acidovorax]OZA58579.1 MAG: 1-deoxy-D-xylulose-5-phosphate reductoisomerase [Acidovorax sp. 17-64-282]HQS63643.1 1-deoxy-D-xylulose-5-phosphate reductoisomerase [Acidovorax defluvii]OYY29333.1 MAG: 1-deoxy-D-xylulose-5-phosphate reductoisomerase [Acidovorax sp. 35-64-16]OYY86801.1 MAG: 1-deoxy-D-xylulose-5-phosphate reductoisomerase [Acidovorax sp. 28-64-14]OYZ46623.1 MAG: 1-deoxy-D-xylulose-5-phosphate reductoisomer